mmetsp:Transcript_7048/g.11601  ORF Transcript_7048/g.11601 Transcript_7048/m.11601 type:complete len:107 (+) Transcript_7048:253-573(+)
MSSSCVPDSHMLPLFSTMICSAWAMVDSRCAITMQVRFLPSFKIASWTFCSVTVSREDVASSSSTTGGSFSKHRAIATRCFSPPESLSPRSPTLVSHPSGSRSMNS